MSEKVICRLCLKSCLETLSLFSANIPDIIETLTNIKIEESDGLPSVSCESCISDLYTAYEIRNRILESDRLLKTNTVFLPEKVEILATSEENHISFEDESNKSIEGDLQENSNDSFKNENPEGGDSDDAEDKTIYTLIKDAVDSDIENEEKAIKCETLLEEEDDSNYETYNLISDFEIESSTAAINKENSRKRKITRRNSSSSENSENEKASNTKGGKPIRTDSDNSDAQVDDKDYEVLTIASDIIQKDITCRPPKYSCKICNIELENSRVFLHRGKHMKAKCKICGIITRTDNIRKHILAHKIGPQICYICGSYHKSIEGYRSHIFNYHKKRDNYKCEYCGEEFLLNSKLWDHKRRVHTGIRPHQCDLCGKAFFASNTLKKHKNLVHLNLRAHPCEFCKKSFSSRYALTTHRRQHTGELPYVCEVCCEGFRQLVSLRTHMKSKHDVIMKPNKPGYTYSQQAKRKQKKNEGQELESAE